MEGREEERSKAVIDVFLSLAHTPSSDAFEAAEQLDVLQTVAELSVWELMLLNQFERYRAEFKDEYLIDKWPQLSQSEREGIEANLDNPRFAEYMWTQTWVTERLRHRLREAGISLHKKSIVTGADRLDDRTLTVKLVGHPNSLYSGWGSTIREHLFSA